MNSESIPSGNAHILKRESPAFRFMRLSVSLIFICSTLFISELSQAVDFRLIGDIDGETFEEISGWSVSLNSDGMILAVGAPGKDASSRKSGQVRVYQYNLASATWTQLGSDIDGEAAFDRSGKSVFMCSDGRTLAVGAPFNDGNGLNSGQVRVYRYDDASADWSQLGNDIDGETVYDHSGWSVSLNADGTILAVGAPLNDGNGDNSGHVRVYRYDANTAAWTQLGDDIDGEAKLDHSGGSSDGSSGVIVSLSADGTILAVGAHFNDGNGDDSGHVRVYRYDTNTAAWSQLGDDIDGEDERDQSGRAISLSADGTILAVGAPRNDGNSTDSGHVRVYRYDAVSSAWNQLGDDIDGSEELDQSGGAIYLSADGTILAVGAPHNNSNGSDSGQVRIYRYDTVSSGWKQLGSDIDGETGNDHFGKTLSLSADGAILAVGAPFLDRNARDAGNARVYKLLNPSEASLIRIEKLETDVAILQQQMLTLLDFIDAFDEDLLIHVHDKSVPGKYTDVAETGFQGPDPDPDSGSDPDTDPTSNVVVNGEFDTILLPWRFWSDQPSNSATVSDYNGLSEVAIVTINQSGNNIQLYQPSIELEPNTDYILTFDAYSNTGHNVRLSVSRHDAPYTNYGLHRVDVDLGDETTGWQTYTVPFTTRNFVSPVSNGRLSFWFANDALPGDHYVFDNVKLALAAP
ncbi:carbohydrate binding domain-containing protein [Pelagicoccus mobilis]|uniref:Carbohydrate binding domain-containing protein n=1 Tax=Pelagicoccus mobilis TaxID=415221 RepID=A0A934VP72_9BACT|nr:carbohydrate binding domain-containing protein [Pelagicoccus mobilis]MBK1876982.1 carbohydrate binding domain-containing protein [Pelagicoccus mobilis]